MDRLLHTTTSLCKVCKEAVTATVVALGDEVWMKKSCAQHGAQEVRLSTNAAWYERARATKQVFAAPQVVKKPANAANALPPLVITSSTMMTSCPGSTGPST